jgi:hypothetical protein
MKGWQSFTRLRHITFQNAFYMFSWVGTKDPAVSVRLCAVFTGVTRAFNCWTSLRNSSLVDQLTAKTLWYPVNFVEYTILWAADSFTAVPQIPRRVWNVNLCFPLPFQCFFFFFERFWNVTFVCGFCGLVNFVYRAGSASRRIGYHTHRKCLLWMAKTTEILI